MHIVVVANGDLPAGYETELRALLAGADQVVAADGGLRHCAAIGIWPDLVVGDLDSAPAELLNEARSHDVAIQSWPEDKDETDLELALAYSVKSGATEITVLAPFGGRLDHELATIGLLAARMWAHVLVTATDGRRRLWVVRSSIDLALAPGQTVSLVPWGGSVDGISTQGLQWPLQQETLALGSTRGVSNVATDDRQTVSMSAHGDSVLLVIADGG